MSETVELEVLLVLRELRNGDIVAYPAAQPSWVAYAHDEEDAVAQQVAFLSRRLADLPAGSLSNLEFPASVTLVEVDVDLPCPGLPTRLERGIPAHLPCLVVPDAAGRWVQVLVTAQVIHLHPEQELGPRVSEEVLRLTSARAPSQGELLDLSGRCGPHRLRRVRVTFERANRLEAAARASERRKLLDRKRVDDAQKLLAQVSRPLQAGPRPTVGRTREIRMLAALLTGEERLSAILVGPSQAGKTAVLRGVLAAHPELEVHATSGAQLVAGQSGFGQLQERVQTIMQAVEGIDAVLYFDDYADLFAGEAGGIEDLATAMRPFLERGRVRIVGEIDPERLEQYEKRHVGFFADLHRVAVEPLDAKATITILRERVRHDRERDKNRPYLDPAAVEPLVELADRYFSYQAFPGKAIAFYDELRAVYESHKDEEGKPPLLGVTEVNRAFSLRSGIPTFLVREEQVVRRDEIERFFRRHLVGQEEAVRRIAETICKVKANLQPPARPLANFLFVGPTGVGKTELAKTLAKFLFGSAERMIRFDMSEYMDPLAAERLIRGTSRDDGQLTRRVRQQPFCVVLLDEIEKAHHGVFDLLLQVLGEGRLSDARGRTAHFHNAIIIMTSNLGAGQRRPASGFGGREHGASDERARAERWYVERVEEHFRPEFVNRIDRIIPFRSLGTDEMRAVVEVGLARIRHREGLADRNIQLDIDSAVVDVLAKRGYSATYGARASRRELENTLVSPLARALGPLAARAEGATLRVGLPGEGPLLPATLRTDALEVTVRPRGTRSDRHRFDELRNVSRRRRLASACMTLPGIVDRRERLQQLVAELTWVGRARQPGAAIGEMHGELAELQRTLSALDENLAQLESAEELAIAAVYEGEPAEIYREAAMLADAAFRKEIVRTLVPATRNEGVALHLEDLDPHGAKTFFVEALAGASDSLGWRIVAHVQGERDESWPNTRPWGPPRDLRSVLTFLREGTTVRHLLVRISGPRSAAYLGRMHVGRWRFTTTRGAAELWVRCAQLSFEVGDEAWLLPALAPARADRTAYIVEPARSFREDGMLLANCLSEPLAIEAAEYFEHVEEVLFEGVVRSAGGDD